MTYAQRATEYARRIVNGEQIACKWIRLAAQRHLADLEKSANDDYPYLYDEAKANRACEFIEQFKHTKGKWAAQGVPFVLEDWQCFFVCCLFGWLRKRDGLRRFRKGMLWVPRKNGKSDLAARIGLYMFSSDNEYGAEVYTGATTEKQAWEVFRPARLMALRDEEFAEHFGIEINAKNLNLPKNGSRFEPIIGNPGDGASPSCAIIDEYHEHDTDDLYDTMETGQGAREQPIMLMITTAGDNMAGPCYALQKEAERVLLGEQENDELFALIYTIDLEKDNEDKWSDEAALIKANPNYGVSVSDEFLRSRLRDAINNPRKQSTFKTKHLNIWVGAKSAFYNVEKWKQGKTDIRLEDYEGERCFVGMDLASKVDIAALEILIPVGDKYARFGKYYLPEKKTELKENAHYKGWVEQGWITATHGNMIDFDVIKDDILDLSSRFELRELAYDPFQATKLITELGKEGVQCVELRPTIANFSGPMKMLEGWINDSKILHNGDPVMAWMVSNVIGAPDAKDNVYPRKEHDENKIDGVIALLMAANRAENFVEPEKSMYEKGGK